MEPDAALADLLEISSEVEAAVVLTADGEVEASSLPDAERARELAVVALGLLEAGSGYAPGELSQVEVATAEGSVFVVRGDGRAVAATTGRAPTPGLVLYDLKSCLRSIAADEDADAA